MSLRSRLTGDDEPLPEDVQEAQAEIDRLRDTIDAQADRIAKLESERDRLQDRLEYAEELEEIEPPDFRNTTWPGQGLWRAWQYKRKRRKLTSEGYVQWYLIDDTFPTPKYIKPKRKSGGIPEYEYDGETYLFPKSALIPSDEQGMWTAVHRRGEADPINPRDADDLAIDADSLKEYLEMRVSSSPPSLLDKFDMDMQDIVKLAVVGIIAYAFFQNIVGGGLPL